MSLGRRLVTVAVALAWLVPTSAPAQDWPARQPIRLVATFPPGGLADTVARILAPKLSEQLGQQVLVDNRPGAGGTLGADIVARSAPDGYTLVLSHAAPHGIAPGIYPRLPYNAVGDFTHIIMIGEAPNVFMVSGSSPLKTLADLIAAAKAKPDEMAYGSSGIGANTHLMGEYFATLAGVSLRHVPYKGSAPALADLWAGVIPSMFDPITTNVGHMRIGKVRVLAVSSAKRLGMFPDVPTFAEQGFPRMTTSSWIGLSAPKGLPEDIQRKLYDAVAKVVQMPDVKARFEEVALFQPDKQLTSAQYVAFISDFVATWTEVSKAAKVVVE